MINGNLKSALSNLSASKFRSLLTMMGIIIGITSVVTVVSLGAGLKNQLVGQINRLGSDVLSVRSGRLDSGLGGANLSLLSLLSASTLTDKDVQSLQQLPQLSAVAPFDFVTNAARSSSAEANNIYVLGTSPDMPEVTHLNVEFGNFFGPADTKSNIAVIGSDVAHKLFGEFSPLGESLTINGQQFVIGGVLAPTSGGLLSVAQADYNSSIFIPFDTAESLAGGHSSILQILVKAKDPAKVDEARSAVTNTLAGLHGNVNFSVLKQDQLLNIASGVINVATRFISAVAAISLLVGGIGIMDIMLVSVSERTREVGLRKAVGATNRQILNQFLTEGLVLTVGGGIIGIVMSLFVDLLLRLYTNWQPLISWPTLVMAVILSVAIGVVFSVAPALKAARKNPIEALRSE